MSDALISLIVATYNVETYIPSFLKSLDAQISGLDDIEIIFVDDGSTDQSADVIQRWIDQDHRGARLVSKPNGGSASARNRGLDVSTAKWVSFPDPDDELSDNYLAEVRAMVTSEAARSVCLVATNIVMLNDRTGTITNTHELRSKFSEGTKIYDLERHPHRIQLSGASAFLRRDVVEHHKLRLDPRIRPNFEDASFVALYLAAFPRPRIAVLPEAKYIYRRRFDGSSQIQTSWEKPEKYTTLLELGYLALFRELQAQLGRVPMWAQNTVLYDLAFFFRVDTRPGSPTGGLSSETSATFHSLLNEILSFIDAETIDAFRITRITNEERTALIVGGKGERVRPDFVNIDGIDRVRRLVRLRYYFAGDLPDEKFRVRGYIVDPVHSKIRAVKFLGQTMVHQRIVWLPATGYISIELDNRQIPIHVGGGGSRQYSAAPTTIWRSLTRQAVPADLYKDALTPPRRTARARAGAWRRSLVKLAKSKRPKRTPAKLRQDLGDSMVCRYARSSLIKRRYSEAWLLVDRTDFAQDNAERLYRYLRDNQPQVNAWFVLSRDSLDWQRLEREGFRLIEHLSRQHKYALLNARHVVSSHANAYVEAPISRRRYPGQNWQLTFLQHGVTKDDLSTWLNPKAIDCIVTATPDEYASFAGDYTPYAFSSHEVVLTGFPRHDRLLSLAAQHGKDTRKRLLIMPTWRRNLAEDKAMSTSKFWESEYARAWQGLIESPLLLRTAIELGYDVTFVPHPNMQDMLSSSPLPKAVTVCRFEDIDVQRMVAESALLVTDYSSMAFEMAYVERPVIYYQFDREAFFSGSHAYRRGTWSYEGDGFGPIFDNAEDAAAEIVRILSNGANAEPIYEERMKNTFPFRDGRCSERTYEAIKNLERRLTYDELYLRNENLDELNGLPVE